MSTLAPTIALVVEGTEVSSEITDAIVQCRFEQSENEADLLEIVVTNPNAVFNDSRVFQPGNEIEVWMGYDLVPEFIGRAVILKHNPLFPPRGIPRLRIKGYDASYRAMEPGEGGAWESLSYADVVLSLASKYGWNTADIETALPVLTNIFQRRGSSDWEFIQGVGNLLGFATWVDWDYTIQQWALHWTSNPGVQTDFWTFDYVQPGVPSLGTPTLKWFEPEYTIKDATTGIQIFFFDRLTKEWTEAKFEETAPGESPKFVSGDAMATAIESTSQLRIAIGETAVEVVANRNFTGPTEAYDFAERWFQQRKDQFIQARGGLSVGLPRLRPRQQHTFDGLGTRLSGEYYFSKVIHEYKVGTGYFTEFNVRKVLT